MQKHTENAQTQPIPANTQPLQIDIPDLRAWHRPELQRLRVSLDTAVSFGSGGDGMDMTTTITTPTP